MNTHEHSNTAGPSWFLSSLALRNRMDAHCTGACPRCVSFVCCTVCCTESTAKEVHPRFGTAGAAAKPRATNATSNATRVFKSTFDFQPVSSHVLIMCFWHFESMNWSRHEPRQNRTGTKHFAVHKLIFKPMGIDANHGNPGVSIVSQLRTQSNRMNRMNWEMTCDLRGGQAWWHACHWCWEQGSGLQ